MNTWALCEWVSLQHLPLNCTSRVNANIVNFNFHEIRSAQSKTRFLNVSLEPIMCSNKYTYMHLIRRDSCVLRSHMELFYTFIPVPLRTRRSILSLLLLFLVIFIIWMYEYRCLKGLRQARQEICQQSRYVKYKSFLRGMRGQCKKVKKLTFMMEGFSKISGEPI